MRIDYLSSDILLFRGDSLAALATAFIDGERALLVDGLASQYDAIELRDYLETTLNKRVEHIVLTDGGGTHAAAVALLPDATRTTCATDRGPIVWGRHTLHLFPVTGARPCSLGIDVPSADLLFVADTIVGNIAALGTLAPEHADEMLIRLQDFGRTQVVPRHTGAACNRALGNARIYLARLREKVDALRATLAPERVDAAIAAIRLDDVIASGEYATPLERHWHADNLRQVVGRALFPASAARAGAGAARGRAQACRETLASVLTAMLGRLVERGV